MVADISHSTKRRAGLRVAVTVVLAVGVLFSSVSADSLLPREQRDFSASVELARPSVVSIAATRSADPSLDSAKPASRSLEADPTTQKMFPPSATRLQGCGIILSEDGYILTNAHLVSGASIISVTRSTGQRYSARIVGIDRISDLAVLQIKARHLPPAKLGNPERLRPGQPVAAIGSPFGLEQSIAVGAVSALDRIIPGDESYSAFIQTDLPLNPGDSGGPLFDETGAVMGVNTEIVLNEGALAGISFAIPIDFAIDIASRLIRTGYIAHGDLGIGFQDTDPSLTAAFGAPMGGVLIHMVAANGAAAHAGLRVGDIVLALQGRGVGSAQEFARAVAALSPHVPTAMTIWRGRRRSDVVVQTADGADAGASASQGTAPAVSPLVTTRSLGTKARNLIGTEGYLLVVSVSDPAAAAGLEVGDVLIAAGNRPLTTRGELLNALRARPIVALLIEREGTRLFVAIPTTLPSASVPDERDSRPRE